MFRLCQIRKCSSPVSQCEPPQGQAAHVLLCSDSLRLIASGLCIGIGSIGPAIGLSIFSRAALNGISRNIQAYSKLLSFTFISEAIIETPEYIFTKDELKRW